MYDRAMTSGNIMAGWLSAGTPRAGMVRPRRPLTQQLLDLARSRLDPTDFRRAWQEGERLSLSDLVQPDSAVDRPVRQTYAKSGGGARTAGTRGR